MTNEQWATLLAEIAVLRAEIEALREANNALADRVFLLELDAPA